MSRKIEAAKRRFEAAKAADHGKVCRLRDFFGANIAKDRKRVSVEHLACPQPPLKWEASALRREEQSHLMTDQSKIFLVMARFFVAWHNWQSSSLSYVGS